MDVAFAVQWAERQHILAVYPDPSAFAAQLQAAKQQADNDLARVNNFTGYRQALNHFTSAFHDEHFSISITLTPTKMQWPGFTAMYVGGRYRVVTDGDATAVAGQEISACDGRPMNAWVQQLAPYEAIVPDLESSRSLAAPLIFRDVDSPFVPRPATCTIGGREVKLAWRSVDAGVFAKILGGLRGKPDPIDKVEPFGRDGVWISLNNINPGTTEQADAFNAVLRQLPALRSKRLIVIDQRNDGGGPYNWFMAFLRGLYGARYTDYYARARLQIANVYRTTPEIEQYFNAAPSDPSGKKIEMPPDGADADATAAYAAALKSGAKVLRTPANDRAIAQPASPGPNLVNAKVVVLTGYSCYSACIGMVDELKRIPGVTQAGTETGVDSLPGTPFAAPLPSGNGVVRVPVMIRDGRPRKDNEPQKPDLPFDGDIEDTAAVKAWVAKHFATQ